MLPEAKENKVNQIQEVEDSIKVGEVQKQVFATQSSFSGDCHTDGTILHREYHASKDPCHF